MPKPRWFLLMLVTVLLAAMAAPPAAARDDAPISDPIPGDPIQSRLGLVLEEFAQFPKTEPTPAPVDPRLMRHARINHLGQLPDGRMYVPDLNGRIYLMDPKERTPRVYLDVGAEFAPDFFSGRGLGTGSGFVAFHPDFARNGKFSTVHTEWGAALQNKTPDWTQPNPHNHGVITEWTAEDPSADTFRGTHREVMRFGFGTQIHGFQQIGFNPYAHRGSPDHGMLYIAAGDGGRGVTTDDPQDMSRPYGKILRIDPMGRDSANGRYGVPADNPFAGRPGTLGEIYAVGMRDPHRFSRDPANGHRILLGHIGEHAIEAIYDVRAGDNLGWSRREGAFVWKQEDRCNLYPLPADDAQYGYDYPVAAYDHDPPAGHPCTSDNGGAAMRVEDRAHRASRFAVQTGQVDPQTAGNDDWKAGVYSAGGVPTLRAFNGARQISVMGWFKRTGEGPAPNSGTADPDDRYNAIGLAGVLSGDSDGHGVRALLEIINVSGELRVVALGRRIDGGASQTFAAEEDWRSVLPIGRWVFLAATFDYDEGAMALYKDGRPLAGSYTNGGDPWAVSGPPEPDLASPTDPRGIKIGGSFPQNNAERNPCDCRMDSLMFLDRAVSAQEVWKQYHRMAQRP